MVGHVLEGLDAISALSKSFCYKGVPLDPVVIVDCGIVNGSFSFVCFGIP